MAFSRLEKEDVLLVIATADGALIKTNRSINYGKQYAAYASLLARETQKIVEEEVRLLRINTISTEVTVSTVPGSRFLLVTASGDKFKSPKE